MFTLESEFADYARVYKYELLLQEMRELFAATVAPLHISEYPENLQKGILKVAEELTQDKIEELKNTDIGHIQRLAERAWVRELERTHFILK